MCQGHACYDRCNHTNSSLAGAHGTCSIHRALDGFPDAFGFGARIAGGIDEISQIDVGVYSAKVGRDLIN